MPFSKRSHEGILLIDHTNSPGVPDEMIIKSGLDVPFARAGTKVEVPIVTCSHCQAGVLMNPGRTRDRAYCRQCDHYICDTCAATGECNPFQKVLATAYAKAIKKGEI